MLDHPDKVLVNYPLLTELVDASLRADAARIRQFARELSSAMESDGQKAQAKEIRNLIRKRGAGLSGSKHLPRLPIDGTSRIPLIEEQSPSETPLFLDEYAAGVAQGFCEDANNTELLKRNGLAPRLFLMLSGPPGTGKSLLAGHVARQLSLPLLVTRLDSLISSKLGETAKNIREVFDHVSQRRSVLFLDEMDAIAKVRDDRQELGELKRVVNTVLQGIDSLPEETIVIAATNHSQLLDPAIWRRFPYAIEFGSPDEAVREEMWRYFLFADQESNLMITPILAKLSKGLNGSDIEVLAHACRRRSILDETPLDFISLFHALAHSSQGRPAAIRRQPLPASLKRDLVRLLSREHRVPKVRLANVLGISRQMIHRYLSE